MESEGGSDQEVEVINVDEEDFKARCEKAKMPPDLPQRYQAFWLKFSEAPPPVWRPPRRRKDHAVDPPGQAVDARAGAGARRR